MMCSGESGHVARAAASKDCLPSHDSQKRGNQTAGATRAGSDDLEALWRRAIDVDGSGYLDENEVARHRGVRRRVGGRSALRRRVRSPRRGGRDEDEGVRFSMGSEW
jgi:hypothetical protein